MEKLDHVHIFVKDMDKAKELFSRILGTNFSPAFTEEKVLEIESSISPLGIELIASAFPDCGVLLESCQYEEQQGAFLAALGD